MQTAGERKRDRIWGNIVVPNRLPPPESNRNLTTCLLEARNAEYDHVKRECPEGHPVKQQGKPETEAPDMQNWCTNDL